MTESIRITSGELKGRSILSPGLKSVHPMGAREKIALFNMVFDYLPGAKVLDAFSGSGALGIEALSRGAGFVTFIEKNANVARVIRENVKAVGLEERSKVFVGDVEAFLCDEKFKVIMADPPYDDFRIEKVNYLTKFLGDDGIFVLSHPGPAPVVVGLKLTKTHKYANANLSVYLKNA